MTASVTHQHVKLEQCTDHTQKTFELNVRHCSTQNLKEGKNMWEVQYCVKI